MNHEVWILGSSGRTARAIAALLDEAGVPLVLVGRDLKRLEGAAASLTGSPRLLAGTLESNLAVLVDDAPGVVINTVGPFTTTGVQVARACPPGTHYIDIANEFAAVQGILGLDHDAVAGNQVFVTAASFGVLATESVVLRLCEGQPRPTQVRVDALAALAIEAGEVGAALAGTIAEIAAFGGREVRNERVVRTRSGAHPSRLTTPDGDVLSTGAGASGDLLAAWRASKADTVIAASTAAPANPIVRLALPAVSSLFRLPAISRWAVRRISRIKLRPREMARTSSWGHARVQWSSGTVREGWLRVGDGTDFTASTTAEIARRLLKGEGRPGAYTPGALFGSTLAEDLGGTFIIDETSS